MLFELHHSFHGIALEAELCEALDSLALASSNGTHVVVANRATCTYLSDAFELGISTRATFRRIGLSASDLLAFSRKIDRRIVVFPTQRHATFSSPHWEISYREVLQTDGLSVVGLLSENSSDSKFYRKLAFLYSRKNGLGGAVHFNILNGAGDQIAEDLETRLRLGGSKTLCLVDSELRRDGVVFGITASRCINVLQNERWGSKVFNLAVHEVENLVPGSIFAELIPTHNISQVFSHLAEAPDSQRYIAYLDLKKGVFGSCRLVGTYDERIWTELSRAGVRVASECLDFDELPLCQSASECHCKLVDALPRGFMTRVVQYLEGISMGNVLNKHSDFSEYAISVGKEVYEWGVAPLRTRL